MSRKIIKTVECIVQIWRLTGILERKANACGRQELDCRELVFCPETDIPWKIPVSNMKQRSRELC